MEKKTKKTTLATIKAFIRRHRGKDLHIKRLSDFNSMTDGVERLKERDFEEARDSDRPRWIDADLGILGAWFVRGSRDHFESYDDGWFSGYRIYNCCGSFILATPKAEAAPMTLPMMQNAINEDATWRAQRGPEDQAGYERDQERLVDIELSTTFDELHSAAPMEWQAAVSNRCHRSQV